MNSNQRSESESRSNPICLPILNRAFGDANLLRDFSLQQPEVNAALPEMIPDGLELYRIIPDGGEGQACNLQFAIGGSARPNCK